MLAHKYLIFITILPVYTVSAYHDYYSSISGLEILLEAEEYLLNSLKNVMEMEQNSEENEFLKTLGEIKEEHDKAQQDILSYLTNPICAFKLIKRFVVDWTLVAELIRIDPNTESLAVRLGGFMNGTFKLPTRADLKGAALGLLRLQETYGLNVSDLAEGKILGTKYSSEMTASECLGVFLYLYFAKEYRPSLDWLQSVREKLNLTSLLPNESMTDVMRYLSTVYFSLGKPLLASHINKEIVDIDPTILDDQEIKEIYDSKPLESPLSELCRMTCRGERHQTPSELRPLRCMFETNGKPYRLIAPFKVEQLSLDPLIVYYHDVITDRDIKKLIKEAESVIERSMVDHDTISEIRTSKTGWLSYEEHDFLSTIAYVLNDITGLSLSTASQLQVVNYGIGGHYGPHWDFSFEPTEDYGEMKGNRLATALTYLNDVEFGGGTAFPFLKLVVSPEKRSVVLWYNLHESLEPDYRTQHTGCPVLKGSKWIMTEWFHERGQEFLRPCSLEQKGDVSAPFKCTHWKESYFANKCCDEYRLVWVESTCVMHPLHEVQKVINAVNFQLITAIDAFHSVNLGQQPNSIGVAGL